MTHGIYLVTGRRRYRGHKPGSTFEAQLEPRAEERAIERGDIRLLSHKEPEVQPGSYRLPDGWPTATRTANERRRKAPLLVERSNR